MEANDFVTLRVSSVGIRNRPDQMTPRHLHHSPVVSCQPGLCIVLSDEIAKSNIFGDGEESPAVDFICVKHFKQGVVWIETAALNAM